MSIIKSMQDWLAEYPGMRLQPLNAVLTNLTKSIPSSYALAPAGDGKTETDLSGNRTYRKNYVFYALESIQDEVDRAENHDFLEGFTDWLEERADNDDFPIISGAYSVDSIDVSNLLLHDVGTDGSGIYQVQIQLTITKWRAE